MPQHASDSSRVPHPARRWLKLAAVAVAAAVAAYALWRWANDMSGVRRDAPKVTAIIPLPPPPPPPPEPEPRGLANSRWSWIMVVLVLAVFWGYHTFYR